MKPYPGLSQLSASMPGATIDELVQAATKQPPPDIAHEVVLPAQAPVLCVLTIRADREDAEALVRQLGAAINEIRLARMAEQQAAQYSPCSGCGDAQ